MLVKRVPLSHTASTLTRRGPRPMRASDGSRKKTIVTPDLVEVETPSKYQYSHAVLLMLVRAGDWNGKSGDVLMGTGPVVTELAVILFVWQYACGAANADGRKARSGERRVSFMMGGDREG
jgi:uncharacterized membrane protein YgdD (TMEM256/DUF423 family)